MPFERLSDKMRKGRLVQRFNFSDSVYFIFLMDIFAFNDIMGCQNYRLTIKNYRSVRLYCISEGLCYNYIRKSTPLEDSYGSHKYDQSNEEVQRFGGC